LTAPYKNDIITTTIERIYIMKTSKELAKLKTSIKELVIPLLTLSNIKKDIGQRGFADELESQFISLAKKHLSNITEASSALSTEDVGFDGINIDVKTSDIDRKFKMPNLISVDKLKNKYYKDTIMYVMISYSSKQHKVIDCNLFYIWELPWLHLAIQNLGKGQLQIKNMSVFLNDIKNFKKITKDEWYEKFMKEGHLFYEKMILKMAEYKKNWLL